MKQTNLADKPNKLTLQEFSECANKVHEFKYDIIDLFISEQYHRCPGWNLSVSPCSITIHGLFGNYIIHKEKHMKLHILNNLNHGNSKYISDDIDLHITAVNDELLEIKRIAPVLYDFLNNPNSYM